MFGKVCIYFAPYVYNEHGGPSMEASCHISLCLSRNDHCVRGIWISAVPEGIIQGHADYRRPREGVFIKCYEEINLQPKMDIQFHALYNVGRHYLAIPKRLNRWSLGRDDWFHHRLDNWSNCLFILGLKLIHVSEKVPMVFSPKTNYPARSSLWHNTYSNDLFAYFPDNYLHGV